MQEQYPYAVDHCRYSRTCDFCLNIYFYKNKKISFLFCFKVLCIRVDSDVDIADKLYSHLIKLHFSELISKTTDLYQQIEAFHNSFLLIDLTYLCL